MTGLLHLFFHPDYRVARRRIRLVWRSVGRFFFWYSVASIVLVGLVGEERAGLVAGAAVLALALWPPSRRRIGAHLAQVEEGNRIERALLQAMQEIAPSVGQVQRSLVGEEVAVRVRAGGDLAELERHQQKMAAALECRSVRVAAVTENAGLARLVVMRQDPLEAVVPWPWTEWLRGVPARFDFGARVPLGVDEEGADVAVPFFEHHMLLGGEPGSGKSVSLSVILAAAAFDPKVDLYLLDGKLIELHAWRPLARRFVGPDVEEATECVEELYTLMKSRYAEIEGYGRKVEATDRLSLLVVDELALFVSGADKKACEHFAKRLRELVQLARAAGIIVVAATQKPSSDLVPSGLRDMFTFKLAHRCVTRDASDTILGAGWASAGYDAATIDSRLRGVGYLIAETDKPRRMRSYHLADQDIRLVVEQALELRGQER